MKVLFEKVKYCENSQRSDDSTGKAMVVLFEKGRAMGNARKCHFRIGVCNKMPLLVEMGAGWCTKKGSRSWTKMQNAPFTCKLGKPSGFYQSKCVVTSEVSCC